MGKRRKHIILAQNNFQYANGFFDIDYTAIPMTWANNIEVIVPSCVEVENAEELVRSFLMGSGVAGLHSGR